MTALRALERERSRWERAALADEAAGLERFTVNGATVVVGALREAGPEAMRSVAEGLRDGLGSAAVVLGTLAGGKPFFVAALSQDLVERGAAAGAVLREVARLAGGGGGGRPDFAQAGGRDASRLPAALDLARQLLVEKLSPT